MKRSGPPAVLVFATAFAGPAALVAEMMLLSVAGISALAELQAFCAPVATPCAWALVIVSVPACWLAGGWKKRHVRARLDRLQTEERTAEMNARIETGAFLLAASIAQVPAILATIAHLVGADVVPVSLVITVSTAGVVMIARPTAI